MVAVTWEEESGVSGVEMVRNDPGSGNVLKVLVLKIIYLRHENTLVLCLTEKEVTYYSSTSEV